MLSQQDIEAISKYEPQFRQWEEQQILAGFGHEGITLVSNIYKKLTGSYPNMSCTPCAVQAVEMVYRELKKAKCT